MCPRLTPAAFGVASCPAAGIAKAATRRKTDAIVGFITDTVLGMVSKKEGRQRPPKLRAGDGDRTRDAQLGKSDVARSCSFARRQCCHRLSSGRSPDFATSGAEFRTFRVPLGCLFISMGERENSRFGKVRAADLKADRQSGCREAAGDSNCGKTIDVEGSRVDNSSSSTCGRSTARASSRTCGTLRLDNQRRRPALGWRDQKINTREDLSDVPAND